VPAPICRPGRGAAAPEANLEKSIPALFLLEQSKIANQDKWSALLGCYGE
jgi:hypothetical protein